MSYAEMAKKHKASGKKTNLTPVSYKWEEVGQTLIGRLESVELQKSKKSKSTFNVYGLDTDDGKIKVTLGCTIDNNIDMKSQLGNIVSIEFLGKGDGKGGHKFNMFNIEVIEETESDTPSMSKSVSRRTKAQASA